MRLLLDMNVSPQLVPAFEAAGHTCAHWSGIGDPRATDETILDHAKENGFVLVTHDLDFGAILATSQADSPSVIQVRMQDVLSTRFVSMILVALERFAEELTSGALLVVDENRSRVRILPMT
jgi:predicted nuclease of predicted toxin-antitoxin system